MVKIDKEPGGSTMIRVSTEVRELIEEAKIIPREPLNDCIKRVIAKYKTCPFQVCPYIQVPVES